MKLFTHFVHRLPLMMFGANWLVCSSNLPRECAPFYRTHVSPVIVVLIRSVNIVSISERDDYLTAAEEERTFGYR